MAKEHEMPKTTRKGTAKKSELPSTLQKSSAKAQRTFAKAHDAAAEEYGEGERAHRTAYSALKHSFEKVGDRWEPKDEKGPSDSRARSGGPSPSGKSAEGVDANASKTSDEHREAAGHLGPLEDVESPVGRRDQEGQPAGKRPQQVTAIPSPPASTGGPRIPPADFVRHASVCAPSCG